MKMDDILLLSFLNNEKSYIILHLTNHVVQYTTVDQENSALKRFRMLCMKLYVHEIYSTAKYFCIVVYDVCVMLIVLVASCVIRP